MNKDLVASVLKSEFKFGDKRLEKFFNAMNEVAATAQAVSAPKQTRVLKNDFHVRKRWVQRMMTHIPPMDDDSMKDFIQQNMKEIDGQIDKCFENTVFLYSKPFDRGKMFQQTIRGYYVNLEERIFFVSDENYNKKVTTYPLKVDIPDILAEQMVGGVCASIISLREEVQAIKTERARLEAEYTAKLRNIHTQRAELHKQETELKKALQQAKTESPKLTSIYDQMTSLTTFLTSKGSV